MCGPIVVRRLVGMERIVGNNEVAGFKFATLGVIYAVLLGLVVISVWEKYSEADDAVTRESEALASLYQLSGGLDSGSEEIFRDRCRSMQTSSSTTIGRPWRRARKVRKPGGH